MIGAVILGIIALIGPPLIIQANQNFVLGRTRIELVREARAAMALINKNLRQAQSNTIKIDEATGQPYYTRITFTKVTGESISYYQSGRNLIQRLPNGATNILTKDIRFLAFSFPKSDDMTIVSVAVTLERNIYQGRTKALHMASEKVRVMN